MSGFLDAEQSVEAMQAYLLTYVRALHDDERLLFCARMHGEDGFAAEVLSVLQSVHDAMVSSLRSERAELDERGIALTRSTALIDSDLAHMVRFTLTRFSPAIVTDLDGEDMLRAKVRLARLLSEVEARSRTAKLH